MRTLLEHPEVATRSCGDCKKWLYDLQTGKKVLRGGKEVKRPKGTLPPCHSCPKKSPEEAHEYELSDRNVLAYRLWLYSKALNFRNIKGRWLEDHWIQKNFAAIADEVEHHKMKQMAAEIGYTINKGMNG